MPIVNSSSGSGDSTFALTNGTTTGRMLVVLAVQDRSPANLEGFTFDGVSGIVYGLQTTASGADRTLAVVWTDSQLPASAGTYNLTRNTGIAGGTSYGIVELSGMDEGATVEVLSDAVLSTTDPLSLTFTNSADAFLGMSLETRGSPGSATVSGGAGQTDFYATNESIATGKIDSSPDNTLSVNNFFGSDEVAYTGVAIAALPSGPSLTITDPIIPGTTTTFSTSGFVDPLTGVRITDAQGNVKELTLASQTSVSAPSVGDLDYALFGSVTIEVYNATESATATIPFNPPAGFDKIALEAGFATDINSFLYQYGGTPAVPDQFTYDPVSSGTAETLTLQTNGYWTATGYGEWTVYAIDATDGEMQSFPFVWNAPAIPGGSGKMTRRNVTLRAVTRRTMTARP